MMKKFLVALGIAATLAACGGDTTSNAAPQTHMTVVDQTDLEWGMLFKVHDNASDRDVYVCFRASGGCGVTAP